MGSPNGSPFLRQGYLRESPRFATMKDRLKENNVMRERASVFAHIEGEITLVRPDGIVVSVGALGYELFTPNPYAYTVGQIVKIHTSLYVREDAFLLYGFQTIEEKDMFRSLLNVSGIGPKGALAILATGKPARIVQAIEDEDDTFLTKFPGIGKKTARQIILDLKGKCPSFDENIQKGFFQQVEDTSEEQALEEAILALEALGYSKREVKRAETLLRKHELMTTDEYIKRALQELVLKA